MEEKLHGELLGRKKCSTMLGAADMKGKVAPRVSSHLLENETALSRANKCLERITKFCLWKKKYYHTKDDNFMLITRTVCLTVIEIVFSSEIGNSNSSNTKYFMTG